MNETTKQMYKGMLNAKWPKDDINSLLRCAELNGGIKSGNVDQTEVKIKCKNGESFHMKRD